MGLQGKWSGSKLKSLFYKMDIELKAVFRANGVVYTVKEHLRDGKAGKVEPIHYLVE